jgi:DNA-binding Lrp family transcriptional regulator
LDRVDRRIIALLQENAKRTFADIGADVGLSSTAVKRRVDRLQHDGVIVGYGARIDPEALGQGIEALIEVYCAERVAPADVADTLKGLDEVISAFTVSGEPDAVIRARVESISGLEKFIERLRHHPNVLSTRTMIVLSRLIDRPG